MIKRDKGDCWLGRMAVVKVEEETEVPGSKSEKQIKQNFEGWWKLK